MCCCMYVRTCYLDMNYRAYAPLPVVGPPEEQESFSHELRGVIPRGFEYLFSHINHETQMVRAGLQTAVTTLLCNLCMYVHVHMFTVTNFHPYYYICCPFSFHSLPTPSLPSPLSPSPLPHHSLTTPSPLPHLSLTSPSPLPHLSTGTSWSTSASVPSWKYTMSRCLTCSSQPLLVYSFGRTCIVVCLWTGSQSRVWPQQRMPMT